MDDLPSTKEMEMDARRTAKKLLPGSIMVLALLLSGAMNPANAAASEGAIPSVEKAFAPTELNPGYVWKIYIKGSDPNGDLRFINIWMDIPGHPTTPVRLTIEKGHRGAISGYLRLNTFEFGGSPSHTDVPISVHVSLEDREGNRSKEVELPVYLYIGASETASPSGAFEERFLGRIPGIFFQSAGIAL